MKLIKVKIKGITPLMQHRMNEETLYGLLGAKTEKKKDKEEKTPREIASAYVYTDTDGNVTIPTSYLVGAFKNCASEYKQKNSVRKSLKTVAGGIFRPVSEFTHLLVDGKKTKTFEVDVRKGNNQQRGAIAVCRPIFHKWEADFEVSIDDDIASSETVLMVLQDAGKRSGIGSFRVQKGGHFGQFQVVEFTEVK